jgi:hypothetical protein
VIGAVDCPRIVTRRYGQIRILDNGNATAAKLVAIAIVTAQRTYEEDVTHRRGPAR